MIEYFDKIDCDLKRGSEEEQLLDAVKKRRTFGKHTMNKNGNFLILFLGTSFIFILFYFFDFFKA